MSNFIIISPNRVGSTAVQKAIETVTGIQACSDILSDGFIENKTNVFRVFHKLMKKHPSDLLIKIHPHQFFNHSYNWNEYIRKVDNLIRTPDNAKLVFILRKNMFDAALSTENLQIISKEAGSMAWIEPYKPVTDKISKEILNTVTIDYFLTVQLAFRQNFPIFWYEDLFNDNPDSLIPLFEYLGLGKDCINGDIIEIFSTKNKLKL